MERGDIEAFVANAALLAGHLTQQCEQAVAQQASISAELQQAAHAVSREMTRARAELAEGARAVIREALMQEIPPVLEAISVTGGHLDRMAARLQDEQAATIARLRIISWKTLGALVVAALAIIGGTGYAASVNVGRAREANVEARVLEALQDVAITSCDGVPCIKLEEGQRRWAKNGDYILVDVQPAAANTAP